jgi:choline dehydrogenase-like flavoprotein
MCEQEPDPESRILLSAERDALGMPQAVIEWRVNDLPRRTILEHLRAVEREFDRLGLAGLDTSKFQGLREQAGWINHMHDAYHHMGTTRMSDDPSQGVVDRHCRVHGVRNLYIGSSAVFPTSGHSNPTLTLIALVLRIADQIKNELRAARR